MSIRGEAPEEDSIPRFDEAAVGHARNTAIAEARLNQMDPEETRHHIAKSLFDTRTVEGTVAWNRYVDGNQP